MKKDRNCGNVPYPIYPPYQGMGMMPGPITGGNVMPIGMGSPMTMSSPMPMTNQNSYQTGSIEQQLSSLNSQVSSLEKRVSSLETLVGNKYNSSNFQIM